ncbi:hypothetical protein [Maricaulis parjimensis]|uniref:hypothetical protein n=1 Tax=Maricaulis parjimensis TaxID=144023 RepID=UPI001939C21A|nr:hypothetical protein [Maricaulis parjimensis]
MSEDTLKSAMLADRREQEKRAQRLASYAKLEQVAEARHDVQAIQPAGRSQGIRTVHIAH